MYSSLWRDKETPGVLSNLSCICLVMARVEATPYRSEDEVGVHSAFWMGSAKHGDLQLPAPQARQPTTLREGCSGRRSSRC
jgi:hypothetical protein